MRKIKVSLLTREYPPYIYGGAGVHVEYLSKELKKLIELEVRCFGDQEVIKEGIKVIGYTLSIGKLNVLIFSD